MRLKITRGHLLNNLGAPSWIQVTSSFCPQSLFCFFVFFSLGIGLFEIKSSRMKCGQRHSSESELLDTLWKICTGEICGVCEVPDFFFPLFGISANEHFLPITRCTEAKCMVCRPHLTAFLLFYLNLLLLPVHQRCHPDVLLSLI